jgi:hypothetical protein
LANSFPFFLKINGIDNFSPVFTRVQKQLNNISKSATKLGQDLSLKLTAPLVALGGFAVKNFIESEDALALVRSRLKEVGDTVGVTEKQFVDAAKNLQLNSLFGDDQILRDVTTQFLTFGNITGEQFLKAQQAALDLSTVLKTDLKAQTIQLGKALDNPIKGLTALRRSGIQFSEAEETLIKSMAKTGRVAEAQTLILQAIEHYYGGAAAAAGNVNPYVKLVNVLGDLTESFGKIINEFLIPIVGYVNNLANFIDGLSEGTKKTAVVFLGLVAAIGPLLIVIGAVGTGISTLIGLMAVLNGVSLLWIIGLSAAALLIYKAWNPIMQFFGAFWEGFKQGLSGAGIQTGEFTQALKNLFTMLPAIGGAAGKVITGIAHGLGWIIGKLFKIFGLFNKILGVSQIDIGSGSTVARGAVANSQAQIQLDNLSFANKSSTVPVGQVEVSFSNLPQGAQVDTKNDGVLKAVNVGYSLAGR